jgi:hypothetical protein
MEDPNANPAMLPSVNAGPDLNQNQNPDATPSPTPTAEPNPVSDIGPQNRKSKFGLFSLISGIITAGGSIVAIESPLMASGSETTLRLTYGVLSFTSFVFMLALSVPSFKRNAYPNLSGMVGFFLNLAVFYQSLSALVAVLAVGH